MNNLAITCGRLIRAQILLATLLAGIAFGAQNRSGLIVEELTTDSPARKIGLQPGDRTLSYNGKTVASPAMLDALQQNTFGEKSVVLEVWRRGQKLRLNAPPGILGVQVRPELSPAAAKLYEAGRTLLKAGNAKAAIAEWQATARMTKEADLAAAAWLYGRIGEIFEGRAQWKEACEAHLAAWQILNESSDAASQSRTLAALGRCSEKGNDFAAAEKWFERARQVDMAEGNEMWVAGDLSNLGDVAYRRGDLAAAQSFFASAFTIAARLASDSLAMASSLNKLGAVAYQRGDLTAAQEYHRRALAIRERLAPDSLDVAFSLLNLGNVSYQRGDLATAQKYLNRALVIQERLVPESLDLAASLNSLGAVTQDRGDLQAAQDYYSRALAIWERLAPNSVNTATTLNNLGLIAQGRGDLQAAQDYLSRALVIRERLAPNSLAVAASLHNLGLLAEERGDLAVAQEHLSRALTIQERLAPNSLDVAASLDNLGAVAQDHGDPQTAQEYYSRALAIWERLAPKSLSVAYALNSLGDVARVHGDLQVAQDYFHRALQIRERLAPDSNVVAESLINLGKLALKKRDFSDARSLFARAVTILEAQRGRIPSAEARAFMVAKYGSAYEGLVETSLALHNLPAAFSASERAKARSLLDLLAEARVDIRKGIDPSLLKRERQLQELLNVKADRQTRLLSEKHTEQEAAAAAKEIDALTTEYHALEEKIRISSPHYAALTQPRPLTLKEIQQEVLDQDSLLLEYSLGEEASSLFVVTRNSIQSYGLPKRAEIEALARQTYELITARNKFKPGEGAQQKNTRILEAETNYQRSAARLSQMILSPAAAQLGTKRLLIVADGALLQIPFAALADPVSSNPQALLITHEILSLPSASVLAMERRELASRKPVARQLALFADPAFEQDDARVSASEKIFNRQHATAKPEMAANKPGRDASFKDLESSDFERAVRDVPIADQRSKIRRLPFSREEANTIFDLTRKNDSLKAMDFDANKKTATGAQLSQYRIVHFATHALLNNDHPDLSGIVLSLVDRQGQPIDGFLRLNEIYNLHLPADLVVLSACQSGLGRQIKGEGLIGLTRGFLYAGAERVLASLWNVDDEATAELMRRFYQRFLHEREGVPAALRQAQIEMSIQKRWSSPYYWASFEMQGEWKSRPLLPVQDAN